MTTLEREVRELLARHPGPYNGGRRGIEETELAALQAAVDATAYVAGESIEAIRERVVAERRAAIG